jgi:tetratricopeptide (TPR) repeat protein
LYLLIDRTGFNQTTIISGLSSAVMICLFLVYFRFIFGFFMRNFERQADTYVYALFDSAQPLISTLEKIAATSGQSADRPNWHHFSIRQRVDYLLKCEIDSSWITRQDKKVKKSIGVYLICLTLLGVLGYQMNIGMMGERISARLLEKIILSEIEAQPDNAELYDVLGNIYYSTQNWSGTQDAWEHSLALKPDNALVLNNLAWHYATCEDQSFRDYDRALSLARLAARLEPSPHILDTLAESYYVNGRYREAVAAGEKALASAREKRSYYREQIEKFKSAMPPE